jgi:hypothetical protein
MKSALCLTGSGSKVARLFGLVTEFANHAVRFEASDQAGTSE